MFQKKIFLTCILALFIVGFFLYAFNLKNGLFWDDEDWIINNPAVHVFNATNLKFIFSHDTLAGIGLRSNYYRPVLFLSFMLNYIISGTKPLVYHLTSNLIHLANAVLIFFLLKRFDLGSQKRSNLVAFLASLMFLIHPLQTEAVTYISGRGDPLSVFFMLLALYLWNNDLEGRYGKTVDNSLKRHSMSLRVFSVIFMILAVLSRETAFLFPLYLTVFLMAFVHKDRFWLSLKRSILSAWPFYAVSLVYGILRLTVLNFQNTLNFYQQSNVYTEHLSYRLYTFFQVIVVYVKLIFIPTGLHMERDVLINTSLFQWPVWFGALIFIGVVFIGFILYQSEKMISHFRIWFFTWGIFFVALLPTSGIAPINALIYEHWLYFSLFGFFTLVAFYLDKLFELVRHNRVVKITLIILLVVYFGFWAKQTIARNIIWGQPDKFYQNILNYEPNNVRALTNLANIYADRQELSKAEELLWKAIAVDDVQPQPYYNLGNILQTKGDIAGAIELYKKSLAVDKNFPYAYQNLAGIYARQGRLPEALDSLEKLSAIKSFNPEVWYNLALIRQAMGDRKNALKDALKTKALLQPSNSQSLELVDKLISQLK